MAPDLNYSYNRCARWRYTKPSQHFYEFSRLERIAARTVRSVETCYVYVESTETRELAGIIGRRTASALGVF